MLKKRDFLPPIGEKMTKSPKKNKAKDIEKTSDFLIRKRRESHYQKKRYQIVELRAKGWSVRKIAEYIRMSTGFVCKWCRRLAAHIHDKASAIRRGGKRAFYTKDSGAGIREAICSHSRAPKDPRRKITGEHRDAVVRVRGEKFTGRMGAQKIKEYLHLDISHQSVNSILKDEGLTKPYRNRKKRIFDPFRRGHSNDLWQIDYKDFEPGIHMFSVKDDYSSMILAADVRSSSKTDDVLEILNRAVRAFGVPKQILSDHGTQWCSSAGGNTRFDGWCSSHGIRHIMGKVRKPTTQGKIERWHGSVLEEAELPPRGSTPKEYSEAVQEYVEFHNNRRPHHGIGLQIPVFVYLGGLIIKDIITGSSVHEVP
jgi:transposase